jgi:hypothetical protein
MEFNLTPLALNLLSVTVRLSASEPNTVIQTQIAEANLSLTQLNYGIRERIGNKKKIPGVQESFCMILLDYRPSESDGDLGRDLRIDRPAC